MTATLVAQGLAGGYGHRTLFDSLDLTVAPGDVVGVVGRERRRKVHAARGCSPASTSRRPARVSLAPADAFVGWLPQEHERVAGETVADYIARRTGCAEATRDMDAAAAALGDPSAGRGGIDPADAYSSALDRWLASGAADLDERLPVVLADLGLDLGGTPAGAGADDLALRRAGGPRRAWPRCCSRASTSCCWTSRPTTSTSTASSGSRRSCAASAAAWCWSATTASSSPAA